VAHASAGPVESRGILQELLFLIAPPPHVVYLRLMFRCYAQPSAWISGKVTLSPEETHHLFNVLRASVGDCVTVFDGHGAVALTRLAKPGGREAILDVVEHLKPNKPDVSITLFQALVKEQKMDLILQKAVELGVSRIIPLVVERSIVRLDPDSRSHRIARWQKIVLNAAKQSGANLVPEIGPISLLADAVRAAPITDVMLIGTLEGESVPFRTAIGGARAAGHKSIGVLIGPEGDFSPAEVAVAKSAGALAVSLGEVVLRVETAALYVLSVLKYEFEPTSAA